MNTNQTAGPPTADTEIGSRIANALIVKGTNARALSDATGISYPTLRRSLTGGRSLTIREIGSIAGALNVPAKILLPPSITEDAA
jgi:transcriptional regulator with XRE-family HTH domain